MDTKQSQPNPCTATSPSDEAQTLAKAFCSLNPSVSETYMSRWFDAARLGAAADAAHTLRGQVLSGQKEPAWVGVLRDITYQLTLVEQDKMRVVKDSVLDKALVQAATLIAPFEK